MTPPLNNKDIEEILSKITYKDWTLRHGLSQVGDIPWIQWCFYAPDNEAMFGAGDVYCDIFRTDGTAVQLTHTPTGKVVAARVKTTESTLEVKDRLMRELHTSVFGDQLQSCRKWMLSYYMEPTEIVRTALLAARQAEDHECCENFRYDGDLVADPHIDLTIPDARGRAVRP